jgi:hypothetical protein
MLGCFGADICRKKTDVVVLNKTAEFKLLSRKNTRPHPVSISCITQVRIVTYQQLKEHIMKKEKKDVVECWSITTSSSARVYDERLSCLSLLLCIVLLIGGSLLIYSPAQAEIKSGDILVADQIGGTNGLGALFLVNPKTGQRVVLSDFGNPAQGPLGSAVVSVAVGAGGRVFVSDLFAGESGLGGAIFEVDPDTGYRTIVSDFGQGEVQGALYYGLVVLRVVRCLPSKYGP